MNFLFVAGCQRSGTTAFADYLNCHEAVLITRERYKYLDPAKITPDLFAFERILDHRDGETNAPPAHHDQLVGSKDPSALQWIGDKNPSYVRSLPILLRNHPGARFIVIYRAVEEVAESFEAKARNPRDHWPEKNGFQAGIEVWNRAQRLTREFIESHPEVGVLVIDYNDFFGDAAQSVPLLASFLDIQFPEAVQAEWRHRSEAFRARRRPKQPLTDRQAAMIRSRKDHGTDTWIRAYIAEQRAAITASPELGRA